MGNKGKIAFGLFLIILMGLSFYRLDYYITKPGGTYNVSEFLAIQNGDRDDEGSFYMTTVAMGQATPLTYAMAEKSLYSSLFSAFALAMAASTAR